MAERIGKPEDYMPHGEVVDRGREALRWPLRSVFYLTVDWEGNIEVGASAVAEDEVYIAEQLAIAAERVLDGDARRVPDEH